jgi:glutamate racemase
MRDPLSAAIGIFDSGIGGLTVVRALRRALPHESIVYLGDTARVPYGMKSADTVIRYSLQIVSFLLRREIKYLVVACNTATAYALDALQAEAPVPVMGVVEPGARVAAASTTAGAIGVIGTLGTISSGAYHRALQAENSALSVFGQPCPLLVPLVEEGWIEHPVTAQVARHYLRELRLQSGDLDTIVLGCTHYPLLHDVLGREAARVFGHDVTLVDSATAVSSAVASDMQARGLLRPPDEAPEERYFLTDVSRFSEIGAHFLGRAILHPQLADI